jgi:hypothetical protein
MLASSRLSSFVDNRRLQRQQQLAGEFRHGESRRLGVSRLLEIVAILGAEL